MKDEIEQIRERHAWVSPGTGMADPQAALVQACTDIATLLTHIDAQDRAIAAHKRDEEQRAETEKAAFENGRKAALDAIRAVPTPLVLDGVIQITENGKWFGIRDTLREARRLLHGDN